MVLLVTKNILRLTDFIFSFLIELLNNIVIILYILNNLAPKVIPGTLQMFFDNNIFVLFVPIFANSITLLYVYHLNERTKKR